ncbi:hypothetical protein NGB36_25215 [Streptomyces sp. RB6PN25]|uniref:DUF4232 domain-containing protein n=1 Tax=Streptomyces humicola TaxID=2953240 RepID=A0ABT1Q1M0_9ACTN|nr:hypothetical protein [Streptomyces humicola]MCQ4083802.1 hypothetical protein [Streptomyces humicola]
MQLRAALLLGLVVGVVATVLALSGFASAAPATPVNPANPEIPVSPWTSASTVPAPRCGAPAARTFPIDARLTGGPATYTAGGAAQSFSLQLRNTTQAECRDVHPLVVIVDGNRTLTPGRFSLECAWSAAGPWRSVPFETTDHAENIGLPGGEGGPGLAVPARGTVTVMLRLRFAGHAAPDRVVASATTMQRRGNDGAWVGESNHYTFDVVAPRPALAVTGPAARRRRQAAVLGSAAAVLVLVGAALVVVARRSRH